MKTSQKFYYSVLVDIYLENDDLIAGKYCTIKDKATEKQENVYMLSNCHNTSMILTGKTDKDGNPEKKKHWFGHIISIWEV